MSKIKEREKAISLRKKGMSYSQIRKKIGTPKSTLNYWLKNYPLSRERLKELQNSDHKIEKFKKTMQMKKKKRLKDVYKMQKNKVFPISRRDLYIAGIFLYWGEGTKSGESSITLANSDPDLINFFIYWVTESLEINKKKVKIYLHLYKDMDIKKEVDFWCKKLRLKPSQFARPYIKKSKSSRINHKGGFGHGTCSATISDVRMKEKIMMSIKSIKENYKGT